MVLKPVNKEIGSWVICCQGTTQLLTAAAAVYSYASLKGITLMPEQIVLLIFDLACPESRLSVFRQAIMELARENYGWFRFEILDTNTTGFGSRISAPSINPDSVEAVFSCRNHNTNDQQIMKYFQRSVHICYGDSVGVYTPPKYLAARSVCRSSGLVTSMRRIAESLLDCFGFMGAAVPEWLRLQLRRGRRLR